MSADNVFSMSDRKAATARQLYDALPVRTEIDYHGKGGDALYEMMHAMTIEERTAFCREVNDPMLIHHYRAWSRYKV